MTDGHLNISIAAGIQILCLLGHRYEGENRSIHTKYALFFTHHFSMSYILLWVGSDDVHRYLVLAGGICLGLVTYLHTNYDFTFWKGLIVALLSGVLMCLILHFFGLGPKHISNGTFILLFSLYLVQNSLLM